MSNFSNSKMFKKLAVLFWMIIQTSSFTSQSKIAKRHNHSRIKSTLHDANVQSKVKIGIEEIRKKKSFIAKTKRVIKPRRKIKTVNPFRLAFEDAKYLSSTALYLTKYLSFNIFANFSVKKLYQDQSLLERSHVLAQKSEMVSRVASLLYSSQPVYVEENVDTVVRNTKTGETQRLNLDLTTKAVSERIAFLVSEDLNNIQKGIYPIPSELKLSQRAGLSAVTSTIQELYNGYSFAQADGTYIGSPDSDDKGGVSQYFCTLATGLDLPQYYRTDFHSIPGGFLSPEQAPVYDLLSETVFSGTFFMARRMVLRPIAEAMHQMGVKYEDGRSLRLLDLGTGTGTFLIQLREAFPKLELHGLDLSPALIEYAGKNCKKHPSFHGTNNVSLVRANMEDIPHQDASFDFVTEINCFHEIPEYAIKNVAREASRVLKTGGLFLHMDAVQMKDDPSIAAMSRVSFDSSFNEPYMMDWMENVDLDDIFAAEGFEPVGSAKPYYASTLRVYRKVV